METVGVQTLRKNLTTLLKRAANGEAIMITSHGHEIAQLVPPKDRMKRAREALEKLQKTAYIGDVISPVSSDWELTK